MTSVGGRAATGEGATVRGDAPALWGRILLLVILATWGYSLVAGFRTGVLYLTFVGMACVAGGLFRPVLGLMGVGMLCTLDAAARVYILTGVGLLRWNTFNFILIFVAVVFLPRLHRLRERPVRMAAILLAFLSFGLLLSPDRTHGVQHLTGLVSFFGILAYCLRASRPEAWHWLAIVCGTLGAFGGLVFNLQKDSLPYINPNAWSYFPLTGIMMICVALSFPSRRQRPLLILLAAVNGAWTFLSGSRGAMLATAVCAIYIVFASRGAGSKILLLGGAVVVTFGMTFLFVGQSDYARQRFERLVNPSMPLANRTSGRSELMLGAWYIFEDHPFGVGTGGFTVAWERMTFVPGFSYFQIGQEMAAHSAWAKTLAENGLIGLALLAGFVGSFAYEGRARKRFGVFPAGLMTTAILALAFTNTEFQSKGLWLLSAATVVILRGGKPRVARAGPGEPRALAAARATPAPVSHAR